MVARKVGVGPEILVARDRVRVRWLEVTNRFPRASIRNLTGRGRPVLRRVLVWWDQLVLGRRPSQQLQRVDSKETPADTLDQQLRVGKTIFSCVWLKLSLSSETTQGQLFLSRFAIEVSSHYFHLARLITL